MVHIPILRAGHTYKSLDVVEVPNFKTGASVALVSQANRGLIAKDFGQAKKNKHALQAFTVSQLLTMCKKAADLFMHADLPIDGEPQSPDDYIRQLSSTTGMSEALCRKNLAKIGLVLDEMEAVIGGLTRGLDLSIQKLLAAPNIDRLNLGLITTSKISWDQPHEGNLFEHLYRQRAFQSIIDNR